MTGIEEEISTVAGAVTKRGERDLGKIRTAQRIGQRRIWHHSELFELSPDLALSLGSWLDIKTDLSPLRSSRVDKKSSEPCGMSMGSPDRHGYYRTGDVAAPATIYTPPLFTARAMFPFHHELHYEKSP